LCGQEPYSRSMKDFETWNITLKRHLGAKANIILKFKQMDVSGKKIKRWIGQRYESLPDWATGLTYI